jgi:7-carboxy-7-deazaguanine synthase
MRENDQLPMAASYDPAGLVQVHSVFPTIQGEGPFCGERALFFRLFGCNLRCPGCDTDYTSTQVAATPEWFPKRAAELDWPKGALVVITGGEPFRQNIVPAIDRLIQAGYRVQVETNGILWPAGLDRTILDYPERFSIVCSPKTSRIHNKVHFYAAAFKYVLRAGEVDADGLPTRALLHKAAPRVHRPPLGALVYVQPMDEDDPAANALNLAAAISSTMEHGHRLQIQVHKIINME